MIKVRSLRALLAIELVVQIVALLVINCEAIEKNIPDSLNYGTYVGVFGKSYSTVETMARAKLFYSRTLDIFKLNSLYLTHKNNYYLKQNEYTDWTFDEMKNILVDTDTDLVQVDGAEISPKTPGDEFVKSRSEIQSEKASLSNLQASDGDDGDEKKPGVKVNLFIDSASSSIEPKEFVEELASNFKIANMISKIVAIDSANGVNKHGQQHGKQMPKVPFRPRVKPENENYDPSLVASAAWADDIEKMSENYAKSMMDNYLNNLKPYSKPVIPSERVLSDKDLPKRNSLFSEVVDSIKNVYDFFAYEDNNGYIVVNPGETNELEKGKGVDDDSAAAAAASAAAAAIVNKIEQAKSDDDIKYDIDWRLTGCIPRPKTQSKCNACYAFATIDLMEFFYCRQNKVKTEFSVQYVIDCGSKTGLNGCKGGRLSNVGQFIIQHGLQLNSAYPYGGIEQQCPFDEQSDEQQKSYAFKPTIRNWKLFHTLEDWFKWLPSSPIIVGINMPADFLAYGGGIHDGSNCTPEMVHAMLLVGSGIQNGKTFWLLKNTFSDKWGEEGYFRLSKKAPLECFNAAIVVRANFKKN